MEYSIFDGTWNILCFTEHGIFYISWNTPCSPGLEQEASAAFLGSPRLWVPHTDHAQNTGILLKRSFTPLPSSKSKPTSLNTQGMQKRGGKMLFFDKINTMAVIHYTWNNNIWSGCVTSATFLSFPVDSSQRCWFSHSNCLVRHFKKTPKKQTNKQKKPPKCATKPFKVLHTESGAVLVCVCQFEFESELEFSVLWGGDE